MKKLDSVSIAASIIKNNSKRCKCGSTIAIPPHLDKVICHSCGYYVFKNPAVEFKYRLKEQMIRKAQYERENNI